MRTSTVSVTTAGSYLTVIPKEVREPLEPIKDFDVFEISIRPVPGKEKRGMLVRRVDEKPGGNRTIIGLRNRLTIPKAMAFDLGLQKGDKIRWEWIENNLWAWREEDGV